MENSRRDGLELLLFCGWKIREWLISSHSLLTSRRKNRFEYSFGFSARYIRRSICAAVSLQLNALFQRQVFLPSSLCPPPEDLSGSDADGISGKMRSVIDLGPARGSELSSAQADEIVDYKQGQKRREGNPLSGFSWHEGEDEGIALQ